MMRLIKINLFEAYVAHDDGRLEWRISFDDEHDVVHLDHIVPDDMRHALSSESWENEMEVYKELLAEMDLRSAQVFTASDLADLMQSPSRKWIKDA